METVLVNSHGKPWTPDGFISSFNRIRDKAAIDFIDSDTGERKTKHLHDVRGSFCTRMLTEHGLTDEEVAGIMGGSTARVTSIRRIYVDQNTVIAALGARMSR